MMDYILYFAGFSTIMAAMAVFGLELRESIETREALERAALTEYGDPNASDPPIPTYWLDNETLISCGRNRHLYKWDGVDWVPVQ